MRLGDGPGDPLRGRLVTPALAASWLVLGAACLDKPSDPGPCFRGTAGAGKGPAST